MLNFDTKNKTESSFQFIIFLVLFSCGVWTTMLTTNLQQQFATKDVRLEYLGFSFWINIGSSAAYLYALLIYLIAVGKD